MKPSCKARVIRGKPFFWPILKARFKPKNPQDVIIAFAGRIYAEVPLGPPMIRHEMTHLIQQGSVFGAIRWWIRYLASPKFRYEQEAAAYRAQYQMFAEVVKDRNKRAIYAMDCAEKLSGPLYGDVVSLPEALKAITQ
ncbi:MAG: hypothetical protein AAB330_00335, partial [Bacteroidota bacterium]